MAVIRLVQVAEMRLLQVAVMRLRSGGGGGGGGGGCNPNFGLKIYLFLDASLFI